MLNINIMEEKDYFEVILEYWNPKQETVTTESGFRYLDTTSVVTVTERFVIRNEEDKEAMFRTLYHRNNSLRYCNGSYWKIKDNESLEREYYGEFMRRYNTIQNYYGNGVVD